MPKLPLMAAMLLLCLGNGSQASPQSFDDEFAIRRVVKIHGMSPQGDWYGTGFLINTPAGKRIITNKHVCGSASMITVQFATSPLARTATIERVAKDRADLCLLLPDSGVLLDTSASAYDVASVVGPIPADVKVYGYPHAGALTYTPNRVTLVIRLEDKNLLFNGLMAEILDMPILPGNSGSPVINNKGEVVGVVFAMDANNPQHVLGLAVPLADVRRFIGAK